MSEARGCIRTGHCCTMLGVAMSPRFMRESWEAWRNDKETEFNETEGVGIPEDIDLLYPMLADRCIGKRDISEEDEETQWHYYYGPCRNLDHVLEGGKPVATCAIHNNKPRMCSGYPFYADNKDRGKDPDDPNPGFARGCGFNVDPEAGTTEGEMHAKMVPLDDDEK